MVVPVGLAAGVLDVFVVHPLSVIPDAWDDTHDALWRRRPHGYVTRMGSTIPLAALTPVVFTFDFLGRSMFDFHPYRYQAPIDKLTDEEKARLSGMNYEEVQKALDRRDKPLLESWLVVVEAQARPDRSEEARLVFEKATWDSSLQGRAYSYLSRSEHFRANEEYLVGLIRSGKAGSHESSILYLLSGNKSRLLSRYWLENLSLPGLSAADARNAIDWIIRTGVKEDVDEVLRRLRQVPVPPKP